MPNEAPFDPCKQWLGIDAVDLGNARLVLGVTQQEADPIAVLRSAEARLNLLRAISPGPFEMARAGLIKRVEEAREKLLAEIASSPQQPRPDAVAGFAMPAPPSSQRAAQQSPVPPAVPMMPPAVPPAAPLAAAPANPAVPPPVPGGAFQPDGGTEAIKIRTTVYRKKTPVAGIALTLLALSAMAGGLVYYTYYGRPKAGGTGKPKPSETSATRQVAGNDSEKDASKPKASTDDSDASGQRRGRKKDREPVDPTSDRAVSTMKPPSRERDRVRPSRSEREPDETDDPIGAATAAIAVPPPPPMRAADAGGPAEVMSAEEKPSRQEQAAGPPAAVVAVKDAKLDAMLAEVLEAMRRQEDDTVARLLGMASKQATGRAAKERVAGWQQLATYYKGFLGYREQAMAAVKPGNEYDVKNQKVGVVEVDDDTFVYRVAGGNKTVPRDKIPAGIVLAIVMEWFDENPANELYLGAYHLAKPEPDPKRAREHWDKALAGGADASGLIPLLDDPVFAASE